MSALDRIATGQATLSATRVQVVAKRKDREGLMLTKHGSQDAYLGCSNVTTTNGSLFAGSCGTYLILPTTDEVYGVVSTGELVISYLEIFSA